MDQAPITDRIKLMSDNGPGYVSRAFRELPGHGGHQAHTGNTLPPSDQRQAAAIPPETKEGRKPGAL